MDVDAYFMTGAPGGKERASPLVFRASSDGGPGGPRRSVTKAVGIDSSRKKKEKEKLFFFPPAKS